VKRTCVIAPVLCGAGAPSFPFSDPPKREWSAGRRQGFARPLYGACEAPFLRTDTGTGLRIPPRGARASCGRFARPATRALRLPALHLVKLCALSAHRPCSASNVTQDDALCEQDGYNPTNIGINVKGLNDRSSPRKRGLKRHMTLLVVLDSRLRGNERRRAVYSSPNSRNSRRICSGILEAPGAARDKSLGASLSSR
jgi:hypothetical protein